MSEQLDTEHSKSRHPAAPNSDDQRLPETLTASLTELQALLLETSSMSGFLSELATLAARSFTVPVSCGITLMPEGYPRTVANSDELASVADEIQYRHGDGPCLRACEDGDEVAVSDLETETRFGNYPAEARTLGTRSIVALPLRSRGGVHNSVGAINLYAPQPDIFADGRLTHARLLAAAGAGAVEVAQRLSQQAKLNEDLQAAMASRRLIDQALGITMMAQSCDADEAFALLRRRSQTEHRKLREVAAELIAQVTGKPPAAAPAFEPGRPVA